MPSLSIRRAAALAVAAAALLPGGAGAAELPSKTQQMLKDLKLESSILNGLDKELAVPQAWMDSAKKEEGSIRVVMSGFEPDVFDKFVAPFKERYPFIDFSSDRESYNARVIKILVSFKEGRVTTDVVTNITGSHDLFKKAGALESLRDMPSFNSVVEGWNDTDGLWVAQRLRNFCMGVNKNAVPEAALPKTWDDLVGDSRWRGGKLALADRPALWMGQLAAAKGEPWTLNFLDKLFTTVKPQLRKEGLSALGGLTIAGEFDASLPLEAARAKDYVDKGAPLAWHCPEPVPATVTEVAVLKGNPRVNKSKLFVNWYMSREGQLSQWYSLQAPPVHKDLQALNLQPLPQAVAGKKLAFAISDRMQKQNVAVYEAWSNYWTKGTGKGGVHETTSVLDAVEGGARMIKFSVNDKPVSAKIDPKATKISVDGKKTDRTALKAGMICEIAYLGNNQEATSVSCD